MSFDLSTVTPFRRRVYEALLEVPKGKVTTYRELSRRINCGSCQAVGQALKCNPFAPDVPCHRVVRASLDIGGFHGHTDKDSTYVQRKIALLREEGVELVEDATAVRVNRKCLYRY